MVSLYELNILLDLAGILFCAVCMLVVAAWRRLLCASARHLLSILGANTLVLLSNCVGLLYKGQPGARIHLLLCASNFLEFAGGYLLSMAATYYIFSCVERSGPPLTVQPLVENAVRYGTGRQLSGVHLTIASWAEEDGYCVRVSDDGPGFDPERYHEDGAPHLGIDSVRSRLASMCGGSLTIASHPGGGTQALIRIPCAPQPRQEGRSAR